MALHCDMDAVCIKATRGEKMGFVGKEEEEHRHSV